MIRALLLALFLASAFSLQSQSYTLTGRVLDESDGTPLPAVEVVVLNERSLTLADGSFQLEVVAPAARLAVEFVRNGEVLKVLTLELGQGERVELGEVLLPSESVGSLSQEDRIPVITLTDEDLENDAANQNISGVLSASRDVFVSAAAFNFSTARFRIRGFNAENTQVFLNGSPMNDPESGRVFWSVWGGLNDVLRNRDSDIGLGALDYAFGGLGGATTIDTRASVQRRQKRFSYYFSNRTYAHRLMGTYSTGMRPSGWALTLSGSHRWAQEGYIPGTTYDAWSYFLSVDRKLGQKHLLNLTALGAPVKRGRAGASTQEAYDLAGTNYYNPYWGWQNGEKRNSRVVDAHQPLLLLRHDWNLSPDATLTTTASYQFGRYGSSALDWFNAPDPRGDYYRKLPSFFATESPETAEQVAQMLRQDPSLLQIDWDALYEANLTNEHRFGDMSGQWSQYILEERRFDAQRLNLHTLYQHTLSEHFSLQWAASYQWYRGENFRVVKDLLGGDYYVNIDKFALNSELPPEAAQFDLNEPNRILHVGDDFGYNYDADVRKLGSWIQGQFTFPRVDFFLAADLSRTEFWRTGNYRSGRFPDNSFGKGTTHDYFNGALKGGVTYKINGRNYLYANAFLGTRAPFFRNAYVSPRTRDELVPDLRSQKLFSSEVGYLLRSPNFKARATAYLAQLDDQVRLLRFFVPGDVTNFGTYILNPVDERHLGLELALEARITSSLTLNGVAAIGQYTYTSRPQGILVLDDDGLIRPRGTVFMKDFYVPGTPQQAFTLGVNYRSAKFWFLNLNFNYFNELYLDFSPDRRIADAVYGLDESDPLFREIIEQTKAPDAFTVDLFGGKSFKFGETFLYLTVGVTNLLDNRNLVTGGFEQLRFDRAQVQSTGINVFPPKLYYAFGTNFFVMAAVRL